MAMQSLTPAWLERLVRRSLQKDADDRWQSMRDVVIELKSPSAAERARSPPSSQEFCPTTPALPPGCGG